MGDMGAGNIDVVRDKRSRSYYGADQRLRYFQERDVRVSGRHGWGGRRSWKACGRSTATTRLAGACW
jgi:hypothetical protein